LLVSFFLTDNLIAVEATLLFANAAQYIGLRAPFAAALLVYCLFKFLDRKASGAAKEAITAWIKGERYKQIDLKAAVVEGFDNLYGTPLRSVRSFLRSATISGLTVIALLGFRKRFSNRCPKGIFSTCQSFI
jgi:hypothetical protein